MKSNLTSVINIITGNNGSGKSSLLASISHDEYSFGRNVICLSNTSTNKFPKKNNQRFHVLKQSSNTLSKVIRKVVITDGYNKKDSSNAHIFPKVLQYLNLDENLSLKVTIFPYQSFIRKFQSEIYHNEKISYDVEEIIDHLTRLTEIKNDINLSSSDYAKASHTLYLEYSFSPETEAKINKTHNSLIQLILKHETALKKHGLISDIEINFYREHNLIPSSQLSSGEACYMTTLAFILINMTNDNTIIIDEPENSLHPLWQKKYTSNLMDLLYYFNIKLILATHSPMIVIGAVEDNSSLDVFKVENNELYPLEGNETNIDEVMVDVFGVLTSRSRYFSYKINEILNEYNNKKTSLLKARTDLSKTLSLGPDSKQKRIIEAAFQMLDEMSKNA